jgi:hypothetical protein
MAATDSFDTQLDRGREAGAAGMIAAETRSAALLERELEALISAEVEAPLGPVASKLAPLLTRQLRQRAREDVGQRPPALAADLVSWTDERLRSLFSAMAAATEEILATGIFELERGYELRIEGSLKLDAGGIDLLLRQLRGIALRAPARLEIGPERSRRMPPSLLLRARLPRPFGPRLVRRGAEARLRKVLKRKAAELRAELARRARDAVAEYRAEVRSCLQGQPR